MAIAEVIEVRLTDGSTAVMPRCRSDKGCFFTKIDGERHLCELDSSCLVPSRPAPAPDPAD